MGDTGLEHTGDSTTNSQICEVGDAKNGARLISDPDLATIIDAWNDLPDALKAGILAMIRSASR